MPGGWEWVVILAVALLIFGRNLPSVMRGLGGSVREFRKGLEEGPSKHELKDEQAEPKSETETPVRAEVDGERRL